MNGDKPLVATLARPTYLGGSGFTNFWGWQVNLPPNDTELMVRVRESDVDAFRALFERYQPVIFRQTLFRTGQIDLSHDIVQETFVRVWERRRLLKPHLSFLAYLFRISGNLVRDAVKHRRIREKLADSVPRPVPSERDDPESAFHLTILEEKIGAVIHQHLSERCRQIFVLSRFEGRSNREISEMLRLSVRTVEHQISRALKILRENLFDDLK